MHGRCLQRIGAIARREVLEIAILLCPHALLCFIEDEKLEFERGEHVEPHVCRFVDECLANIAGRAPAKLADEVGKADGTVFAEWIFAHGVGKEFCRTVDKCGVLVGVLGDVPEIQDFTERIAVLSQLDRLFRGDQLVTELGFRIDHPDVNRSGVQLVEGSLQTDGHFV